MSKVGIHPLGHAALQRGAINIHFAHGSLNIELNLLPYDPVLSGKSLHGTGLCLPARASCFAKPLPFLPEEDQAPERAVCTMLEEEVAMVSAGGKVLWSPCVEHHGKASIKRQCGTGSLSSLPGFVAVIAEDWEQGPWGFILGFAKVIYCLL